jgi:hypothetical protein
MQWCTDWVQIEKRIKSFGSASNSYYASISAYGNSDYHGVGNSFLIPTAKDIFTQLDKYYSNYKNELPPSAAGSLQNFLSKSSKIASGATGIPGVGALATALLSFSSEFEHHIADAEVVYRSRLERAFFHLQRSIVVDQAIRNKWKDAFKHGETACENLGSVHLLDHGFWAFKAHGVGERTDLVLGSPVDIADVQKTDSLLVLTEWKRAKTTAEVAGQATQAITQAKSYGVGVLGGIELQSRRYLIIVTEKREKMPTDIFEKGVEYRHINLAVDPDTPSGKAPAKTEKS